MSLYSLKSATHSFIARQFQDEYTHAKLSEVQQELRSKINCNIKSVVFDDIHSKFIVKEEFMKKGQRQTKVMKLNMIS